MHLQSYTKKELLEEIKKRETIKDNIPEIVENPDLSGLIKLCKEHVEEIKNGMESDDNNYWFYEAVIDTFFGANFWKWKNE